MSLARKRSPGVVGAKCSNSQFQSDLRCDSFGKIRHVCRALLLVDGFVGKIFNQFIHHRTPSTRVSHVRCRVGGSTDRSVMSINLVWDSPRPPNHSNLVSELGVLAMAQAKPTSQRVLQGPTDNSHLSLDEESEAVWAGHTNPFLGQFGRLILVNRYHEKTRYNQRNSTHGHFDILVHLKESRALRSHLALSPTSTDFPHHPRLYFMSLPKVSWDSKIPSFRYLTSFLSSESSRSSLLNPPDRNFD